MKMSQGIGHEPSLQRLVIASVVLHFILMALFFIPFKTGEKEFKTYYVSLVEPSKVSGGGEVAARKAEEKPAVKKETAVSNKKIAEKKEQMSIDDKTVAAKIQALKDKNAAMNALKEKARAIGIIRSKKQGASAIGASKGEQIASDSDCPYCTLISDKITNEWEIPPDFDSSGLEVIISIKIDRTGKVISKKIDTPSGNKLFDDSALKAISKASPLDLPPLLLVMEEIVLRFHP
ncbi:MAG: TonB family protein [Nitrospirota bacterium]